MTVSCQWQLFVTQTEHRDSLVTQVGGVMQSLLDLEAIDQRLSDSEVSIDLDVVRVVIEVDIARDDYQESVSHALGAIRTAIHAAGARYRRALRMWTPDRTSSRRTSSPYRLERPSRLPLAHLRLA